MEIIKDYNEITKKIEFIANRFNFQNPNIKKIQISVNEIIDLIKTKGLKALKDLTEKYDHQKIENFQVSAKGKFNLLNQEQKQAILLAKSRIESFQKNCLPQNHILKDENNCLTMVFKPIESVGVYIPGGNAPLLSSVLMTVIPAQIANVKRIVIVSPPPIHDYILAVADCLGIEEIYQIGGAQAIASLAFGIEEINLKAVDKIVGPGNFYVTLAKKEVFGTVGIDALYGPSEIFIIADKNANPKSIAFDLMGQLEHGSGLEAACFLTDSEELANQVSNHFNELIELQKNKKAIKNALANYSIIGIVESLDKCFDLANYFSPEHLELKITDSHLYVDKIKNSGAVFLNQSNEALGDYLAGPSHCLPTGRSARFSSGLSVYDFLKSSSLVNLKATDELRKATAILARMEGLEAHACSAENV